MAKRTSITLTLVFSLLLAVGCSSISGTDWLRDFRANSIPNPGTLVSGVEATSAISLLYIQGLIRTPSPCYDLTGEFAKSGDHLTLRVKADGKTGTGCDSGVGGFRYNAVIGDLKRRTYELKVVHVIEGGQDQEFNLTVAVVQ